MARTGVVAGQRSFMQRAKPLAKRAQGSALWSLGVMVVIASSELAVSSGVRTTFDGSVGFTPKLTSGDIAGLASGVLIMDASFASFTLAAVLLASFDELPSEIHAQHAMHAVSKLKVFCMTCTGDFSSF